MSRFGIVSLENIDKEVDSITPKNTKKSKMFVWCQFQCFCKERNYKFEKSTSKDELASMLKDWGFNMKRKNGEDYKESVVKIMWNSTSKQLQEFYYNEYNIKFDLFTDVEFSSARAARDAKQRNLQTDPKKRKLSSAAVSKQEIERMVKMCDENTPTGLQEKFFLIAGYELAWRGGEASACRLHHFSEEKNNEGANTGRIEYNPVFTKTCQGGAKKLAIDSKWLITNENSSEICSVRLFKKLLEKRTKFITTDRLFLTANPNWRNDNSKGWYKNVPIGRNTISTWMNILAKKIGIDTKVVKITNHSIRASAVSNLAKEGVNEEQLIKVTGHSNAHSIRPYMQMVAEHHKRIVERMRNDSESRVVVNSNTSSTSSDLSSTGNVYYNSCVFNFN